MDSQSHSCARWSSRTGDFFGADRAHLLRGQSGSRQLSWIIGCSLFLVLSGYLITRVLMADEIRFRRGRLRRFFLRRFIRILPALLVFLICLDVLTNIGIVQPWSAKTWAASL